MGIPCQIRIDGVAYEPREPYVFACLPRIGETISLEWRDDHGYPQFVIHKVLHIPDGVQELPAFTVLFVKESPHE